MYYEINVSLNGQHHFATASHSIKDEHKAKALYDSFKQLFPVSAGYTITITKWENVGTNVEFEKPAYKAASPQLIQECTADGYTAYKNGKDASHNPFIPRTDLYLAWQNGWLEAYKDS